MKKSIILLPVIGLCGIQACAQTSEPSVAFTHAPAPAACATAADLFWVADTRKMDEFLAKVQMPGAEEKPVQGEDLPDTRAAWRDYAIEARALARKGRAAEAAGRLAQMLKLAAVYRAHGGLENVVQAEEIRYLAGRMAEELGASVTAKIQSPYLEKNAAQCLARIGDRLGGEISQTSLSFRQNLAQRAVETYARLARTEVVAVATRP